jgi:hypothetical protein
MAKGGFIMEYDLSVYIKSAVAGVPLLFVVMGLVWFWGKLGVTGKWQLGTSMLTGLVLGAGFMVTQTRPPVGDWYTSFIYWFSNVIYGAGLGLLASGFYNIGKTVLEKALAKFLVEQNAVE